MPVVMLPLEVKDELVALRRDLAAGVCHHDVAARGWASFRTRWIEGLDRVDRRLHELELADRFRELLVEAYLVRAEVLLYADFRASGYAALRRALELSPEDPDLLARLVRLELSAAMLERAAAHLLLLRPARERVEDFDELEADLKEGLAQGIEEDLRRDLEAREAALRADEPAARGWADLAAGWLYERFDLPRAAGLIEIGLAVEGDDPEAQVLGAEIALEAGDHQACLARARRASALDPAEPAGRLLAVSALVAMGRHAEALAVLAELVPAATLPIRFTGQDLLFQGGLAGEAAFHRLWLALLAANRVGTDSIDYFWSPGTPSGYFERSLDLQRIFHEAHLLDLDPGLDRGAREAGYQALLAQAPEYTLLLDRYARFLVEDPAALPDRIRRAGLLAEKAVELAEAAGDTPPGFRATLAAARSLAAASAPLPG